MIRQLNKYMSGMQRRIRLIVSRGVVSVINDSLKHQNLQISVLDDETMDDVERFQNYGHTSVPPAGSEAIVLSVGGKRQHPVAIVVGDKSTRLNGLEPGDSVLYHLEGHFIKLTKEGVCEIACTNLNVIANENISYQCQSFTVAASKGISFDSAETTTTGNFAITGTSMASDHVSGKISFNQHLHKESIGDETGTPI